MGIKDWIKVETQRGAPVEANGLRVTPISQAVVLRTPYNGFAWNRPLAVEVEGDGPVRRIPIVDVTRLAQIGIGVSLAIILSILSARLARRSK